MRTGFKLVLLITSLLISGIVISSEYDWKEVRDQDGIQVYLKKYWADDIKSFKGIIKINSSVDSILAVILDLSACSDWIHHCKKSTLLFRKSFAECYHHQIQNFPFPAQNRDFIFHTKIVRSPQTGIITVHMNTANEFCITHNHLCSPIDKFSNLIRVKHSHGHYRLEPLKTNATRVTWTQHTNPEGNLPVWLINQMVQEIPYKTLRGLQKKVREDKYQTARLIINAQGKMIELRTRKK